MKVTKNHLRRIIREEARRMKECGEMPGEPPVEASVSIEPLDALAAIEESQSPEGELVVEMEIASRNLRLVVESINAAASLCPDCVQEVAVAGPLIDAMVSQVGALQETLEAVEAVITENSSFSFTGDVAELPGEEAFGIGYEAGRLDLS